MAHRLRDGAGFVTWPQPIGAPKKFADPSASVAHGLSGSAFRGASAAGRPPTLRLRHPMSPSAIVLSRLSSALTPALPLAIVLGEEHLPQADDIGRDLNELVVLDVFQRLFQ